MVEAMEEKKEVRPDIRRIITPAVVAVVERTFLKALVQRVDRV
jgi:hypothetical protein